MRQVHPIDEKAALVIRLRKILGQVQALEGFVSEDADCTDILNEVISARNALKSLGEKIIHSHVRDGIENVRDPALGRRNLHSLITVL